MRDKRDELSETENRFAKQMREFTDDRSIQYDRFPGKSFKKRNERSALAKTHGRDSPN